MNVSHNAKVGIVAATYAAQTSCPATCPLRGAGCYAESGPMALHTGRLNRANRSAIQVARDEAMAIDALKSGLPLRLHVVGDCRTKATARIVSGAAARYIKRTGARAVWTYTHAWRDVPRDAWAREVSVLASCENVGQVKEARAHGYRACAVVVASHPADGKAYNVEGVGKVVPCPNQVRDGVTCADCKLCWSSDRDVVVAFAAHGGGAKKALRVIQ